MSTTTIHVVLSSCRIAVAAMAPKVLVGRVYLTLGIFCEDAVSMELTQQREVAVEAARAAGFARAAAERNAGAPPGPVSHAFDERARESERQRVEVGNMVATATAGPRPFGTLWGHVGHQTIPTAEAHAGMEVEINMERSRGPIHLAGGRGSVSATARGSDNSSVATSTPTTATPDPPTTATAPWAAPPTTAPWTTLPNIRPIPKAAPRGAAQAAATAVAPPADEGDQAERRPRAARQEGHRSRSPRGVRPTVHNPRLPTYMQGAMHLK